MPQTLTNNKTLAEAANSSHGMYPWIKIAPISIYEDENLTIEIVIPKIFQ